jgi:hypothetical protein
VVNGKSDKGSKKRRKEEIVKSDPSAKNLPDLVFVVQFHDPTGLLRRSCFFHDLYT